VKVEPQAPRFAELERLATSADIRDRAFAAGVLSLCRHDPEQVATLYERIRETARSHHAGMRARIRDGTLDKHALIALLREASADIRDHLVEEILDIAYPPLEGASLPRETMPYCPSGIAEILFTLENAYLGPGTTFVDLGSGLGKVVLLAALLTGARVYGVEIDPVLVSHARSAARSLRLDNAHFIEGDIRSISLPPADVYYMYIPVIHPAEVVARLMPFTAERRILLFSQALNLQHLPWLRAAHESSYWLEMYEGPVRPPPRRAVDRRLVKDCERRIHHARAAVFAADDGVVPTHMTDLEREWRTLSRTQRADSGS